MVTVQPTLCQHAVALLIAFAPQALGPEWPQLSIKEDLKPFVPSTSP